MKLKDLVKDDRLIEQLNLNPYCINEGADPEEYREVEVADVRSLTPPVQDNKKIRWIQ